MKRTAALLLALLLLMSLCACGKDKESLPEESSSAESKSQSVTPSAAPSQSAEAKKDKVLPDKMNEVKYACKVSSYDGLTLRVGPGVEYEAMTVIPDGTELTELANKSGWVYVDYDGQQGWVFGQYLVYTE